MLIIMMIDNDYWLFQFLSPEKNLPKMINEALNSSDELLRNNQKFLFDSAPNLHAMGHALKRRQVINTTTSWDMMLALDGSYCEI